MQSTYSSPQAVNPWRSLIFAAAGVIALSAAFFLPNPRDRELQKAFAVGRIVMLVGAIASAESLRKDVEAIAEIRQLELEDLQALQAEQDKENRMAMIRDHATLQATAQVSAIEAKFIAEQSVLQRFGGGMLAAQPQPQAFAQPVGQPAAQPVGQVAAQPVGQPVDQVAAQPVAQPAEQAAAQPLEPAEPSDEHLRIVAALRELGCESEPRGQYIGPSTVQFLFKVSSRGGSRGKIMNMSTDLQLELESKTMPLISIEDGLIAVTMQRPENERQIVKFAQHVRPRTDLSIPIGMDIQGRIVEYPLSSKSINGIMIGGAPGGGKSCFINSLIFSLAYRYTPAQVRLAVADGKGGIELSWLDDSPFLAHPVAETPEAATRMIKEVEREIKSRNSLIKAAGVQHLNEYNAKQDDENKIAYLILIVDEVQELLDLAIGGSDSEAMASIASLGRAAGVLLILSTQRPDRKMINAQVDAKMSSRLAFRLSKAVDSETILGEPGATALARQGDCLYKDEDGRLIRLQGIFSTRDEARPYLFPEEDDSAYGA